MPSVRSLVALAANNLRGDCGRAAYLVITLAITAAAWLLLAALANPFVDGGTSTASAQSFDLIIRNGSQTGGALPLSYARRIETTPGARDVFWYGIQGVECTAATTVSLYAEAGPGAVRDLRKQKVHVDTLRRWQADPLGAIISDDAISKCGWQVGQEVEPPSVMGGRHVALHVIGTFPGSTPIGYLHYDYFNRANLGLQGQGKVVTYFASARDPHASERVAARIEAEFAHDFPAVDVSTNSTTQNAWARFGKVQQLLAFVMAAILLCAASVLVSVLAHAAVQRSSQLALLQILGFQRSTLFSAFTLELLATVVLGAVLGIGLAKLIGHELASTTFGFLSGGVKVPPWAWWWLPAWLAVVVVAALVWPAAVIARVRPADYRAI